MRKNSNPKIQFRGRSQNYRRADISFWSRVIRPNIKSPGHVIMDLWTPEGKFERRIISKSHKNEGGYRLSRQVRWGDLWRYHKRIPNKFRKTGKWGKRLW